MSTARPVACMRAWSVCRSVVQPCYFYAHLVRCWLGSRCGLASTCFMLLIIRAVACAFTDCLEATGSFNAQACGGRQSLSSLRVVVALEQVRAGAATLTKSQCRAARKALGRPELQISWPMRFVRCNSSAIPTSSCSWGCAAQLLRALGKVEKRRRRRRRNQNFRDNHSSSNIVKTRRCGTSCATWRLHHGQDRATAK